VATHLLADGHAFDRVYFKPHPRSRTTEADLDFIRERYPAIRIIDGGVSIVPVIAGKPTVATLTSGVGLEAAVRGCKVHTFGIPFYSHWGFTTDHIPCERRTNRLSAEDVLLHVMMRYTRYADRRTWRSMDVMDAFAVQRPEA
jgi:capsular polysaccharide export protein